MSRLFKTTVVILIFTLVSACVSHPVVVDFGVITRVATIGTEQGGAFYLIQLDLNDDVPLDSNLFLRYEVLAEPGTFKTLTLGSLGDARTVKFRSVSSPAVKAGHIYTLQLYLEDSQTGQKVAAYNTLLSAKISANIGELLNIKLL